MRRKVYGGLTIAESFKPNSPTSVLSRIVMRQDSIIDDFVFVHTTLEGDNATYMILKMHNDVGRTAITRHCS